ncbi:MAG: DUF4381 domain-containing protein [Rhodobacteraceae bacterium]|nr:MAG: DUF4381 domain-containing protein [Paracoccaceae bacterium]
MTPLSPEIQAELAKLHDIRLPEPVGWWPLAPGWWGLIALVVLVALAALALDYRRRRTVRFAALHELAALKDRLGDDAAAPQVAADLAVLVRRIVLTGPEAQRLARMSGPDWVAELGRGKGGFSDASAAFVANAPYAPARDRAALATAITEAETWIRRHK